MASAFGESPGQKRGNQKGDAEMSETTFQFAVIFGFAALGLAFLFLRK